MFTTRWAPDAAAFYDGLDENRKERVDRALFSLAQDPLAAVHSKKLHGPLSAYRSARVGRLRLIFQVDTPGGMINLLVLTHRRDAY